MVTNNEITNTNKSDIINSKEIDKGLQREIIPVSSSNIGLGFETGIPQFNKILVTYDDSEKSDRAIKYAIYLSKISGAEITILQVLGNLDKLENSYINVSNKKKDDDESKSTFSDLTGDPEIKDQNYSVHIEGEIVKSMEDKIKAIENTGFKNKVSFKIRSGFVVGEITKETIESKYDLLIISSSHMDSWIKSLFSETRKIISNVNLPVLLLH
jgi:nucleotide-binding universal stress UspA family protein